MMRARPATRLDRVAPWLILGPALSPEEYPRLVEVGVTHVVDLRSEARDDVMRLVELGLGWFHIEVPDREAPTDVQFAELLSWLEPEGTASTLYVHCQGGIGRTPTVATALLMLRGFTRDEAERLVRVARPESAPTALQRAWLDEGRFLRPS
jgi:protein-tyrosine phosphatase